MQKLQLQLVAKLLELKTTKGLKNNELASMIQVSEGTMSDLLNGKKEFSETLISKCLSKLTDFSVTENIVPVRQAEQITNILKTAQTKADMRLIIGNTGIGKSLICKKVAKDNSNTYYLKIDRAYTWGDLLVDICRIMGIERLS
jgi:DNA transposition AAA+ family ATPase